MAFTINYTRGGTNGRDSYDDSHEIVVNDWGLLEVRKDGGQVKLYSPNFWQTVTPGETKSAGPRRIR